MKELNDKLKEHRVLKSKQYKLEKEIDSLFGNIHREVENSSGKVDHYLFALPLNSSWRNRLERAKEEFRQNYEYEQRVKRREEEEESQGYYDE